MDRILLAHGSGGRHAHELIGSVILEAFGNDLLAELDDGAVVYTPGGSLRKPLAYTTDGYVVKPRFFPGGDIGKLAVCGTINDLAVMGAQAQYLSCSFIIEEGLPLEEFRRILKSMSNVLRETGVKVVTGDTKVVEKGAADGIFIVTSGVGPVKMDPAPQMKLIKPGDVVIISGTIGDHGVAVMAEREGLEFKTPVVSDCAPLVSLVRAAADATAAGDIRFMRDPTRGGLASALNEIAGGTKLGIALDEEAIPLSDGVDGLCELLGLDPLYVANEGKIVFVAAPGAEEPLLRALRDHPAGERAARIGEVVESHPGKVVLRTLVGGTRIVDMLAGEQLPRIC